MNRMNHHKQGGLRQLHREFPALEFKELVIMIIPEEYIVW